MLDFLLWDESWSQKISLSRVFQFSDALLPISAKWSQEEEDQKFSTIHPFRYTPGQFLFPATLWISKLTYHILSQSKHLKDHSAPLVMRLGLKVFALFMTVLMGGQCFFFAFFDHWKIPVKNKYLCQLKSICVSLPNNFCSVH